MKSQIRKQIREKLNDLSNEELDLKNTPIFNNFIGLDVLNKINSVNCYISKANEAATSSIIKHLLQSGKRVSVPYAVDGGLCLSLIDKNTKFKKSTFDIFEPVEKVPVDIGNIELFIVPVIAFDERGNRLGRGKGHYDKFLSLTKAIKIGLAFEEQVVDNIPLELHDVKMDIIITDKRIIKC